MSENNNLRANCVSVGLNGKDGFLGRWQITKTAFEDFGQDLWHDGTEYRIVPFESDSDKFMGRCLEEIVRKCDAYFVRKMKNIKVRKLYVPMIDVGGKLICLHTQMPELSFDFLNVGVIKNPMFKSRPFEPVKGERNEYEYQSIWLSLTDVIYSAHQIGESLDQQAAPTVILMPIHYLSFDNDGMHHVMMSWGDTNLSNFTTTPLPEDEYLTKGKPVYSKPVVTFTLMFIAISSVCGTCAYYAFRVWNSLDIFVLFKLVVLAIPLLLIYTITWYTIIGLSKIFGKLLLKAEKSFAIKKQRKYVEQNIRTKLSDIHSSYPQIQIPNYANFEVKYDVTEIESAINRLQKSMAKLTKLKKQLLKERV